MLFRSAFLAGLMAPLSATAADLNFCWVGGNGYTMTGRMQFPDHLESRPVITEDDVTLFKIAGYRDGVLIGTWNMRDASDDSTWHLRFDPQTRTFLTGGSFPTMDSQGWNADGDVANCGTPGFGFNTGNYAQDVCVNDTWIAESSIDPATPLKASSEMVTPDCGAMSITSKSRRAAHSD